MLFSYLSGENTDRSFSHDPLPAQRSEPLRGKSLESEEFDDPADGSGLADICAPLLGRRLTTCPINSRTFATAGWSHTDSLNTFSPPKRSSPTILVADSDEET